ALRLRELSGGLGDLRLADDAEDLSALVAAPLRTGDDGERELAAGAGERAGPAEGHARLLGGVALADAGDLARAEEGARPRSGGVDVRDLVADLDDRRPRVLAAEGDGLDARRSERRRSERRRGNGGDDRNPELLHSWLLSRVRDLLMRRIVSR